MGVFVSGINKYIIIHLTVSQKPSRLKKTHHEGRTRKTFFLFTCLLCRGTIIKTWPSGCGS